MATERGMTVGCWVRKMRDHIRTIHVAKSVVMVMRLTFSRRSEKGRVRGLSSEVVAMDPSFPPHPCYK